MEVHRFINSPAPRPRKSAAPTAYGPPKYAEHEGCPSVDMEPLSPTIEHCDAVALRPEHSGSEQQLGRLITMVEELQLSMTTFKSKYDCTNIYTIVRIPFVKSHM